MTAASAAATLSSFACFGSTCIVLVDGRGRTGTAADAVALARRRLLDWHLRFSRFDPLSELSRVNADPRRELPVGRVMARLAAAVAVAGRMTGGLVDGTLVEEIETAGYRGDLGRSLPLPLALRARAAPPRGRSEPRAPVARDPRRCCGGHAAPAAGRADRRRRTRQGPVRRPARCAAGCRVVQATALGPTALEAEIRAKAALLSGPARARAWLPHGGVVVYDDGRHEVMSPPGAR